jgi:glycosyltransferase involved in cell wall biosynthesis
MTTFFPPPPADGARDGQPRRALLFFLSARESYRRPLFSAEEIFCGPDAGDDDGGGGLRCIRTEAGSFDIQKVLDRIPPGQRPDYVVVKADATGRNFPRNLAAFRGPKVLLVGDTHHMDRPIRNLIRYAKDEPFDAVIFDHTRHHARFFAEAGLRNLYWIPALDYGYVHRQLLASPRRPVTFVGQVGRFHPYRAWVLEQVKASGIPLEALRGRLEETADIYADSLITLNVSLNGDLNLRVFEALAAGGFLLTDELGADSGLDRLFEPGKHLDTWRTPGELAEKIRHYLSRPGEIRRIRELGQEELLRNHHPDVKLREFHALVDGGDVNPRYDLRSEPWWPRPDSVVSPGLGREIAAYEALQEMHRTAREVLVFAADPASLSRFGNLPRLKFLPLEGIPERAPEDGIPARRVLWWDETVAPGLLAQFAEDAILAPSAEAAARPDLADWGFGPAAEGSPEFRLADPLAFADEAWKTGAREVVRAHLQAFVKRAVNSDSCAILGNFARLLGEHNLQQAALKKAIGLDRNNTNALLALAAMTFKQGDKAAAGIILEEAARVAPLPAPAEKLRLELAADSGSKQGLASYRRAIGRVKEVYSGLRRRILVITNLFPPQELGGYGRKMWEFASGLRSHGHVIRVLTANEPSLGKTPTPEEAELEALVSRTLPLLGGWKGGAAVQMEDRSEVATRAREIVFRIDAVIREFRPEAVLLGNMDFLDFLAVETVLGAGLPVVHALGNAKPGYAVSRQPGSPRYCVGACSDWTGRILREAGYSPARIETIYPGARVDRYFRFFLPDAGSLRICFASLVLPFKGAHVLVDALLRLHRAGVDFTAEMAGDAPDPAFKSRLMEIIREAGLERRISFPGFLDRAGLAALFARSNVLVFPTSTPEPFGISQVEAMAAGLVVVSSGTGGAGEIIRHGVDGLLFQAGRGDDLARKLLSLVQDRALANRLQRAGQSRAMGFAVEISVRKIERIFEELLATAPEAAATGVEEGFRHAVAGG